MRVAARGSARKQTYEEAARFLYALAPRGVSLGLERVQEALAQRGHPERSFRSVLVAGTNGKGSVASMLASMLRASGLSVGLYTSPHLHRIVERFQVNGRPIAAAELRPPRERARALAGRSSDAPTHLLRGLHSTGVRSVS